MIGKLTELTLNSTFLALNCEQLTWPQKEEDFTRLRNEANRLLSEIEVKICIPETQEKYLQIRKSINNQIYKRLSEDRQRILGDTIAFPMFFLHSMVYRVAVTAPFGLDWHKEREVIEECITDLGIPIKTINYLEKEIGWIIIKTEPSGEPTITYVDALKAGGSFLQKVWEEFVKKENSIEGGKQIIELLTEVKSDIKDFRNEYRQDAHILKQLLQEQNTEVMTTLHDIQERLISAGIEKSEAEALTERDPEGLWERITRWASGVTWKDAAEEALWAALDFVPAGTTVKLGLKVSRAVRKTLKKR